MVLDPLNSAERRSSDTVLYLNADKSCHPPRSVTLNGNTCSFLQALRRFISRRGPIRELHSDLGTNFVGAENELNRALQEMDEETLETEHRLD